MHYIPGEVYHIYNQGNNQQRIFFNDRNYSFFLQKIHKQLTPVCELLCWCLMPNHFHLLVMATANGCAERPSFGGKPMQEFSYQLGMLLSSYSQAINKQNGTSGSLFQQKTKAKCVSGEACINGQAALSVPTRGSYLITCMHYIHQNPLKAKLVEKLEDWPYSSFRQLSGADHVLICNEKLLWTLSGYESSSFYADSYGALDEELLKRIW